MIGINALTKYLKTKMSMRFLDSFIGFRMHIREQLMNDVIFTEWVKHIAVTATTESRWAKIGKASASYSIWLLANHPDQLSEYLKHILEKLI